MIVENKKLCAQFLLAVFVTLLGFRALHFLEHQEKSTDKHEKLADEGRHECQVCYIVFGTTFLGTDEIIYSFHSIDDFSEYRPVTLGVDPIINAICGAFSLRAPPISC